MKLRQVVNPRNVLVINGKGDGTFIRFQTHPITIPPERYIEKEWDVTWYKLGRITGEGKNQKQVIELISKKSPYQFLVSTLGMKRLDDELRWNPQGFVVAHEAVRFGKRVFVSQRPKAPSPSERVQQFFARLMVRGTVKSFKVFEKNRELLEELCTSCFGDDRDSARCFDLIAFYCRKLGSKVSLQGMTSKDFHLSYEDIISQ